MNRREFIKTAGIGTACLLAGQFSMFAEGSARRMEIKAVNVCALEILMPYKRLLPKGLNLPAREKQQQQQYPSIPRKYVSSAGQSLFTSQAESRAVDSLGTRVTHCRLLQNQT